MLSRRHIRVKVMQSLYAYFSTKENNMPAAEKSMLKHIEEVVELNLVILSLLVELVKYADNFFEDGKKKMNLVFEVSVLYFCICCSKYSIIATLSSIRIP